MALRFVTLSQIRAISGVSTTLVSDQDLTTISEQIEFQVERFMNTSFTGIRKIERQDPNLKDTTYTAKAPLLTLRYLEINSAQVTADQIKFDRSGKVQLNAMTNRQYFFGKYPLTVILDYYYGYLEPGSTQSTLGTATLAGSSVTMTGASVTGFALNDWVEITGRDGNFESAMVTSITPNLVLDYCIYPHVAGSLITKLELPTQMIRLLDLYCAKGAILSASGQKYDSVVSFTLGEYTQAKVPITTALQEAYSKINSEIEEIRKYVNPIPSFRI